MVRISLAFFFSFVLLFVESSLVMRWMGYTNGISFENYHGLFVVCGLNFFLAFAILTQITPWFLRVSKMDLDDEDDASSASNKS